MRLVSAGKAAIGLPRWAVTTAAGDQGFTLPPETELVPGSRLTERSELGAAQGTRGDHLDQHPGSDLLGRFRPSGGMSRVSWWPPIRVSGPRRPAGRTNSRPLRRLCLGGSPATLEVPSAYASPTSRLSQARKGASLRSRITGAPQLRGPRWTLPVLSAAGMHREACRLPTPPGPPLSGQTRLAAPASQG